MILKKYKTEFTMALIAVCVLSFMVFFNNINRHIRIKEMKIYLQESNRKDNNLDHIGLVMKYRLHKRLYEEKISQDSADMIEVRVNSILSEKPIDSSISLARYRYVAVPSLYIINFFRNIIGKDPIRDIEENKSYLNLEIAYYYERNKCYDKALQIYNTALEEESYDRSNIAAILLHQGFCHAVIGNYKEAKEKYNAVIKDYGDEDVAMTAVILLRFLEGFRSEILRITKGEKDSVVKGEKLYKLIAYKESLGVLERIEEDVDPSEKSRVKLFKARCMEELAEKEKAVNIYQEIIAEDRDSEYAKLANRRIFVTGMLAYNGSGLKELAVKNNEFLKDDVFTKLADEAADISRDEDDKGKLKKNEYFKDSLNIMVEEMPVLDEKKVKRFDMSAAKAEEKPAVIAKTEKKPEREVVKTPEKEQVKEAVKITEKKPEKTPGKEPEKMLIAPDKKPEKKKSVRTTIETLDGSSFVGTIVDEDDTTLTIKTMLGRIKIEKSRIDKQEDME